MSITDRIRHSLFLDWDDRVEAWDDATDTARAAIPDTVALVQDILEKQLDRVSSAVDTVDTKASLIIPGVGVIAATVVGHLSTQTAKSPVLTLLVALMGSFAFLAVVFSLVCLSPTWRRANGPDPRDLTLSTGDSDASVRLGYVNQLGFAVETTSTVLNIKALLLNTALRLGSFATIALFVDAALGGLA
jgi:hypothetical protein